MKKKDCINNLLFGRQLTLYFTFACVICLITGCHRSADSPELLDIYDYVSDNPQKALGALDSIDYCGLSSANRHFHDFLTIKAKDKAYISHTGDSIILDVISYYADKGDADIYAETLYYGGRVYSDLGDYPTSLRFFQKALDILPDKQENLYMRANIVSQLGRLLHKLCLYDEARKYISMSIEIDKQLCDTINTIYDLQLLGFISIRSKEYDFAEQALREALSLSNNQPEHLKAKSLMYLAEAKYKCGNLDSAINFIRNTSDLVQQRLSRNYALGYAARIYKDAGITDTAYSYAHEIIKSPNPGPRELAYHVLLSPEIRKMIPQDTLDKYISEYVNLLEEYSEHDKIQFAINQQNLYNYELHERDKIKAQKSNEKLRSWSVALVLLSFVLATVVLYLKNRSKARILQLQEAIDNIKKLKAQLEKENIDSLLNNQLNVKAIVR